MKRSCSYGKHQANRVNGKLIYGFRSRVSNRVPNDYREKEVGNEG